MTLFNIGPGELLLVLIMSIVVLGPQRLPEAARKAGRALRSARQFIRNIDPQLLADFREITQDFDVMRQEVYGLRAEIAGLQQDLASAAQDVSGSVNSAISAVSQPDLSLISESAGPAELVGREAAGVVMTGPQPGPVAASPVGPDASELLGKVLYPSPRTAAHRLTTPLRLQRNGSCDRLQASPNLGHVVRPALAGSRAPVVRPRRCGYSGGVRPVLMPLSGRNLGLLVRPTRLVPVIRRS